ncbi:MAG: hypothetical protein AAF467_18540 [Actinomycetota bacterium]
MTAPLSDEWVAALVAASADRQGRGAGETVAITIGKTKAAAFAITDGQVAGPGDPEDAAVTVPVTAAQLDAIVAGETSLAQDFMRGDVKPVGATGPLLALVELFEDEAFRRELAARL